MKPQHHPLVKRARRRGQLLARTGRWRPDHLKLAASGHMIYVDTSDRRGWEIIRGLGRGHQPALMDLWVRAVRALEPTVAIDVGANYGEMLLSARYPTGAQVYGVEPNPVVASRLRRSVAAHPDGPSMTVLEALASDGDDNRRLWVDATSSGSASASRPSPAATAVDVQATALDALVTDLGPPPRLVLKVDAEGWEDHVLRGAQGLLEHATSTIAIVEFEPAHLVRAGTVPAELFSRLQTIGTCWTVARDGALQRLEACPADGGDVLAISDPTIAAALGAT